MKPARFDYARPATLAGAIRLLVENRGARLVAGGQSLGPMLNLRIVAPDLLVDISRLDELSHAEARDDHVVVGAAVRHADLEDGRIPSPLAGVFERVAIGIAYRAVRNRGTLGGSLAHADPAADWPAVMIALGAELRVVGLQGARPVAAAALATGPLETCLAPDEVIESLIIPRYGGDARFARYKINAKPGDFAEAMAVILHDPARGEARAVLSGARQPPAILATTSRAVLEQAAGRPGALDLAAAIDADLAALGRAYAFSAYELAIRRASLLRAAREIIGP